MSETIPPPPPVDGSSGPEKTSKPDFKPGKLVDDQNLYNRMKSGKLGTPGKEMALLHQMGVLDRLTVEQLSNKAVGWAAKIADEADEVVVDYTESLAGRIEERLVQLEEQGGENQLTPEERARFSDRENMIAPQAPVDFTAIFRQGRNGRYETAWRREVEFRDVTDTKGRNSWVFLNMGMLVGGKIPGLETQWKRVLDNWILDLTDAKDLYYRGERQEGRDPQNINTEVSETRKDLIALMAVSSSAEAMRYSGGSSDKYAAFVTQAQEPDLDKQDLWAEFLLHNDPEKYYRVVSHPLVKHYYDQILKDAGIPDSYRVSVTRRENDGTRRAVSVERKFFDTGELTANAVPGLDNKIKELEDRLAANIKSSSQDKEILPELKRLRRLKDGQFKKNDISNFIPNRDQAKKGPLFKYLADVQGVGYGGGFDAYKDQVLLPRDTEQQVAHWKAQGYSFDERKAAAKIACDAFLVDKFTRWEYAVTKGYDLDHVEKLEDDPAVSEKDRHRYSLKPFVGWGGDPFRSLLEPSFLPRRIKGVYKGEKDDAILIMADRVFLPPEIFSGRLEGRELKPTSANHLKNYVRLNKAMGLFYGDSRAGATSDLSPKTFTEALPQIVELLDTVYGTISEKVPVNLNDPKGPKVDFPIGKHIVGKMITQAIETKALAAASETLMPGFMDIVRNSATASKDRENARLAVAKFVWGEYLDAKTGLLVKLASPRTRIVTNSTNKFGSQKDLDTAYSVLLTNNQKATWWDINAGAWLNSVFAYAEAFARFNP